MGWGAALPGHREEGDGGGGQSDPAPAAARLGPRPAIEFFILSFSPPLPARGRSRPDPPDARGRPRRAPGRAPARPARPPDAPPRAAGGRGARGGPAPGPRRVPSPEKSQGALPSLSLSPDSLLPSLKLPSGPEEPREGFPLTRVPPGGDPDRLLGAPGGSVPPRPSRPRHHARGSEEISRRSKRPAVPGPGRAGGEGTAGGGPSRRGSAGARGGGVPGGGKEASRALGRSPSTRRAAPAGAARQRRDASGALDGRGPSLNAEK